MFLCSANIVVAQVTMMKNITRLENSMPTLTSRCASLISWSVAPLRWARVARPADFSSSTSRSDCQKNRYGVIVVPSTPTIVVSQDAEKWISGVTVCLRISGQWGCTTNAVTTEANSEIVSDFRTFASVRYGRKTCASSSTTPKNSTQNRNGRCHTSCADAAMPAMSAPTLNVLATMTIVAST